jgi:hypothetical protein
MLWADGTHHKEIDMNLNKKSLTLFAAAAIAVPLLTISAPPAQAQFGISISVGFAPPPLPVYAQPEIPGDGYIWTPGYWAYGDAGYYWIPGAWVLAPQPGYLWTPAYWGYDGGVYGFHPGYWGEHVGYYGGINYGFGYGGIGFYGGEWRNNHFFYNSAAANFGHVHVTNVYVNRDVIVHDTIVNRDHVAFSGRGGIDHPMTPQERQFSSERHVQPTANQQMYFHAAAQDRTQLASVNHGRPSTIAASNPAAYHQVAEQHARTQPISTADRSAGKNFNPSTREANQDQRVSNGLRSGQMTSGEAARATANQSRIDQQVHNDRTANGGTLTNQEHQQINREQNNQSRQIYNDNHNANTVKPNAIDNREANQQQRTAQGIRSGQETSGEAARTNANQSRTDQTVHNDRTSGGINQQQRQQINRQQNRNSGQVNNQKHNNATRPPAAPREEKEGGHPHGR